MSKKSRPILPTPSVAQEEPDPSLPPPPPTSPVKLSTAESIRLRTLKQSLNVISERFSEEAMALSSLKEAVKNREKAYQAALKEVRIAKSALANASTEIALGYGVPKDDITHWKIALNTMTLERLDKEFTP